MRSVCLVGKGKGWKDAPHEGEVWGITQQIKGLPVSRIIDMNDYSLWGPMEAKWDRASRERAATAGIPYYDLSTYPLDAVIAHTGVDYFSNTVDYAIALAIYEGVNEIHLYGINMELESEYAFEKPGVDFWCGFALGRGIKIIVHGMWSSIMRTRDGKLYGYGVAQKENGRPHKERE